MGGVPGTCGGVEVSREVIRTLEVSQHLQTREPVPGYCSVPVHIIVLAC